MITKFIIYDIWFELENDLPKSLMGTGYTLRNIDESFAIVDILTKEVYYDEDGFKDLVIGYMGTGIWDIGEHKALQEASKKIINEYGQKLVYFYPMEIEGIYAHLKFNMPTKNKFDLTNLKIDF